MSSLSGCSWRERVMLAACGEQPETPQIRAHLAECEHCRRLYADMRALEDVRIPMDRVPERVHQRILVTAWEEASARKRPRSLAPSWLRGIPRSIPRLAWAAGFLVAIGIGAWQYMGTQPQPAPFLSEELDYGFAIVEKDLEALESEIELSLLDVT